MPIQVFCQLEKNPDYVFYSIDLFEFFYILDVNPLWDIWFVNIFSHSASYPFTLLAVSLIVQNLFSLMTEALV